jgi:hypothetical protein
MAEQQPQTPADFPLAYYQQATASGANVLNINTKQSLVIIDVRRGGALAKLGHDHVVASRDVSGYVDITGGRADLYVPLDRLLVDEPALRAETGLNTRPSEDAVEATRRNMLVKVLEAGRFPFALIHIKRSTADYTKLNVTITLHDTSKTFEVPAQIEHLSGGLRISGQMMFNQTDFGITPFSILGGALQVQDRLALRFRIFAANS